VNIVKVVKTGRFDGQIGRFVALFVLPRAHSCAFVRKIAFFGLVLQKKNNPMPECGGKIYINKRTKIAFEQGRTLSL